MKRANTGLLILLTLLVCILPLTVSAQSVSFSGTVGSSETFWFHMDYDSTVESASIDNGSVPPGMYLGFPNPASVTLTGTPSQAGSYRMYISVYTDTGDWLQYTVDVTIQEAEKPTEKPASGTPKVTKNPTGETVIAGESAVFIARADHTRQYVWEIAIADAVLDCVDLPGYLGGNIQVSGANTERLVLSNIPESLNNAYVRCRFVGAEESVYSEYAKIRVIAQKDATPVVTKDPTDETVDEDGAAVFVATAKYAQVYRWQMISPEDVVYDCATASTHFPGLKVTGANTERLTLSNIPAELDGYRIRCEFTAGSVVFSKSAKLHVNPKPTEATTEATTEAATEATTLPVTEATTAPTEPPATKATEETPVEPPEQSREQSRGMPWYAVVLMVAAAGGIGAVVTLMVIKKKSA